MAYKPTGRPRGRPRKTPPPPPADPLLWYKPSPTQLAFHKSWSYYSLVRGGGRSGKTSSALIDLAWCLRGIHPFRPWCGPFTALCLAIDRKQSAMVTQRKLLRALDMPPRLMAPTAQWRYEHRANSTQLWGRPTDPENADDALYMSVTGAPPPEIEAAPLLPEKEVAEINGHKAAGFFTAYQVVMKNGCEAWFAWSDLEDIWQKIQGPKIGYAFLDENCGNRKLIIEVRKRLQDSQVMRDSSNPGDATDWRGRMVWAGHGTDDNEEFDAFASMCERGITRDAEGNSTGNLGVPDHELFDIKPGETGAVTDDARDRFAAALTEEERAIHVLGQGSMGDLVRVFKNHWHDDRNLRKEDYVVHPDDNLWVTYDPGVDHPMGMLVAATRRVSPRNLIVVKCWLRKGGTIVEDVDALEGWLRGRRIAGFVYDAAMTRRMRGGGPTEIQQLKRTLADRGIEPIGWWTSKKNHAPGINLMRQMFVTGLITVNPSPESGGPLLVNQVHRYKGREGTKFTGPGGIIKKDDDLLDPLRYLCMVRPQWAEAWRCGPVKGEGEAGSAEADELEAIPPPERYPGEARQFELSALAATRRGGRRGPRVWRGSGLASF